MKERELFRMAQWLLLAAVFYALALSVDVPPAGGKPAMIQTGLWKAAHITSGAFLGYWIDRHLFGRFTPDQCYTPRAIARALVVGCAILGMAFGL